MCTNSVPPVLQMFTGSSAVKSLPPVKIENHHGTCTPIFDPCCCFGGLYGGLYGIGPQSWMAADSTMSYNIWADGTSSNNMWKAIGHQMIGAFGNNLVGATSMLTSPQTLLSFGGAAAGGAASIFSNLGKMCS